MSGTSAGKQESSERTLYEGVACLKSSIGEVQKPGQDRITPRLPGQGWSSRAPEGDGPRAEAEPLAEKCSQPNHSGGLGWGRSWGQKGLKCFLPTPDLHWCSGLTEKCMCGGGEGGYRCSICKRLVTWRDKWSELRGLPVEASPAQEGLLRAPPSSVL